MGGMGIGVWVGGEEERVWAYGRGWCGHKGRGGGRDMVARGDGEGVGNEVKAELGNVGKTVGEERE